MPSRAAGIATSLVIAGLVGGCSDPGPCLLFAAPGLAIEVKDASTNDYIADLVHGVATEGAFEDSLRVIAARGTAPAQGTTIGGVYERAGMYAVHIEGPGYEAWDTANVEVVEEGCHVRTVSFTARLVPAVP